MAEQAKGAEMIVAGDLNVDPESTGRQGRDDKIVAVVETAGIENLIVHSLLRR